MKCIQRHDTLEIRRVSNDEANRLVNRTIQAASVAVSSAEARRVIMGGWRFVAKRHWKAAGRPR